MDSTRFDRLSRMFASRHGRRATLAGLGGLIIGVFTRAAGPEEAEAQPTICLPPGGWCFPSRGLDCCSGSTCQDGRCRVERRRERPRPRGCQPTRNRCCRNRDCPNNLICAGRSCRCRAGQQPCEDRCIANEQCCGDHHCPNNLVCADHRCGCPAGQQQCEDRCIPNDECCGGCAEDEMCRDGACVSARCGHGSPCRVFVSGIVGNGNLGGLDGADALCQAEADGVPALEGGIYRAWLSINTESPSTRFSHLPDSGPFEMTNGTAIANSWADLMSGSDLLAMFNRLSDGSQSPAAAPFTNTTPFGTSAASHDCNGWTSSASTNRGLAGATWWTDSRWTWTDDVSRPCDGSNPNLRLFCFEQR